ncbi:MAG: radical SAM protein [Candidatus Helarchaeota archaeon]
MSKRIYSRFRFENYYNLISTVDCIGCQLKCIFCFNRDERREKNIKNEKIFNGTWDKIMPKVENNCYSKIEEEMKNKFYFVKLSPKEVFQGLTHIAKYCPTSHYRISGCEPTLDFNHLLEILKLFKNKKESENEKFFFILETNGIFLGKRPENINKLNEFKDFLHIRISFKTPSKKMYYKLTGINEQTNFHQYPYEALKYCLEQNISVHPVLMREFIWPNDLFIFKKNLMEYTTNGKSPNKILKNLEFERLFLYDYIVHRFKNSKIKEFKKIIEGIKFDLI